MKKTYALLALGVVLVILCVVLVVTFRPESPADPTEVPTQTPTDAPTDAPTEAPTEVPTEKPTEESTEESTDPSAELKQELQALFGNYQDWYNRTLISEYDSPKYINLSQLFYNGFKDEPHVPTDAEWAELKDKPGFEESTWELIRLPVSKIDAVLKQYFGITLKDIKKPKFDGFVYLESTDCYYTMHTDVWFAENFKVIAAEKQYNSIVRMTYTVGDGQYIYVAELKAVDGGYQILSNHKNVK